MPNLSARPMSLAARERLRDHQALAAQAVAAHSASSARVELAISRRTKVVAEQDAVVAAATAKLAIAIGAVAHAMGVDAAADILSLSKTEVRRYSKGSKPRLGAPRVAESSPKASPQAVSASE